MYSIYPQADANPYAGSMFGGAAAQPTQPPGGAVGPTNANPWTALIQALMQRQMQGNVAGGGGGTGAAPPMQVGNTMADAAKQQMAFSQMLQQINAMGWQQAGGGWKNSVGLLGGAGPVFNPGYGRMNGSPDSAMSAYG